MFTHTAGANGESLTDCTDLRTYAL